MPLAVGDNFAGFTILRLLGAGGMGEVYLVDHPRLPRKEALKILPNAATADREFRERFNREADLAAELWHPHIVAVHDRGEFNGQLWITMDYVEGTDVAEMVRNLYPSGLPQRFAAEIVTAVADALDYAHERGLLHRDVKPANIMVTDTAPTSQRRRTLLTDFGIARRMDDTTGLTATNMTVGSIAYMSPEQLMGSALDGRADQYALAATAYQLLTGKPPFDNANAGVVISHHLSSPPPRVAERRPDLGVLDSVISKGMAKNAADRYQTCSDFAKELAALVDGEPSRDHPTRAPIPTAKRIAPQSTRTVTAPSAKPKPPPAAAKAPAPKKKTPGTRRIWITVAVICAVSIAATGAYVAQRLMRPAPAGTAAPAHGAHPLVPDSAADRLLVGPEQLNAIVGQPLEEVSKSNVPFDSAAGFNRPKCSGAIYPLESQVYNPTGYKAIRQSLFQTPEGAPSNHVVDQSVALLPSAERAEKLRAESERQWQECAGKPLTITDERGVTKPELANVEARRNLIIQDRTVTGSTALGSKCQHTLGVWSNVVAEAVVCGDADIGDQSQIVVETILSNAQR